MLRTLQGFVKLGNHFFKIRANEKTKNKRNFTTNAVQVNWLGTS